MPVITVTGSWHLFNGIEATGCRKENPTKFTLGLIEESAGQEGFDG